LVHRPVAAVKAAHHGIVETAESKLPSFVPRDKTTRNLIAFGAAAYLADGWDPFPIGESLALTSFAIAAARGAYLHKTRAPAPQPALVPAQFDNFPNHGLEYLEAA
jgi:hypothetical protein